MRSVGVGVLLLSFFVDLYGGNLKIVDDFQTAAAKANAVLVIPDWEQTPEAVEAMMKSAIAKANKTLDEIGAQDLTEVTFRSTAVALDDLLHEARIAGNKATIIMETNVDKKMRAAGENATKLFQDWVVGVDYREDVYRAIKAFADTHPKLPGEDEKLLAETLRDFRRAGMELEPLERTQIKRMRSELSKLTADFESNLLRAKAPVIFTKAELEGVPEDFLSSPGVRINNDHYQVRADVMWQYNTVEDNARNEAARKKLYAAHDSLAQEQNAPLINRLLALRNRIALKLGYQSWADYQAEVRMAKSAANAQTFIDNLVTGIQSKFDAELHELQQMKAADTGDRNAKIDIWDWRYYTNQLNKQKFAVDEDSLRTFFPLQQTVDEMFSIFGRVFGLRFEEIEPPVKWTNDVRLYVVSDNTSNAPLGVLYLDLFPREGKTGGGGESEVVNGRHLADGRYQAPVATVVLNFPPLLRHSEAEILFHELGHALHCILTRAKYSRFAGTHVPVDFVEAPSQMLQNWIWDNRVLDRFAADYRDHTKRIPVDSIKKMNNAKLATAGMFYRRQFAFADADLALHGPHPADKPYDCVAISNSIFERVFLPIDPQTSFITSFRGLNGYDAGYYGYAWGDAIAADMGTVFEKAKDGYLDKQAGMKLRREIYEPGNSRDVTVSIEKFLGRKQSIQPFLKKMGVASQEKEEAPAEALQKRH
jgi:thimet oligopeptidase